jgi:hypothetical protein
LGNLDVQLMWNGAAMAFNPDITSAGGGGGIPTPLQECPRETAIRCGQTRSGMTREKPRCSALTPKRDWAG